MPFSNKRLFLIGPSGHGKSRTANTLIGSNEFRWGDSRGKTIYVNINLFFQKLYSKYQKVGRNLFFL
jgi:ABC-type oligopeptide transport system ATPase subunit